nr:hypothetical protein [Tanacetum cinerariifolium]
ILYRVDGGDFMRIVLVLLVFKVTVVFNKVNAAKLRVTTAVRVSTTGWIKWLEDQDMRAKELKIYSLGTTSGIEASGEYDLWLIRIKQYFLMTDYSLWEVIKNGNKVLKKTIGTVEQIYEPTSVEEKLDMKNEMKARGTLLMALPNKDQLKLQKLIIQLEIQGEVIEQLDINLKLLRSLPSEWKTHALIWRNKAEIKAITQIAQAAQMKQITLLMEAPKNQENRGREYGRKIVPVENPTENGLIGQDGIGGYDCSYQAEEEHPTNYTLMVLTSSRSSSSSESK